MKAKDKLNRYVRVGLLLLIIWAYWPTIMLAATNVGGTISSDTTWTLTGSPYIVTSSITVQGSSSAGATLTIEPGVQVRFNQSTQLTIGGASGNPGALIAQGTAAAPIVFTSNQTTPTAGYWNNIKIDNTANDATTILSRCMLEYGGSSSQGMLYLSNAKPAITYCIFRYSSHAGIYIVGSGANEAQINFNNFINNLYGIYISSALPVIRNNNFSGNTNYGLYYSGSGTLNAENNWWGATTGPNTTGDKTYGSVDADPWSTAENQSGGTPANYPPLAPSSPQPADNAINISPIGGINLSWVSSDPNPTDMVYYDLFWGTSATSLVLEATGLTSSSYVKDNLSQGVTYYWQVKAKDNLSAETLGPVWHLTTSVMMPDLIVSGIAITPAGHLQPGQSITLTATVRNTGNSAVMDAFAVGFQADGVGISTATVNSAIASGGSIQASTNWTYNGGDPVIRVVADSQSNILEADEANNSLSVALSSVADNQPPTLSGTSPAAGAHLQNLQQIRATLSDSQSAVDDAFVMAHFALLDGNQHPVSGTISESSDTFTFIPGNLPLALGSYQMSLTAADTWGNTQSYTIDFTIDETPPEPTLVSGTISKDTIWTKAGSPYIVTSSITIQGTDGADGITTLTIEPGVQVRFNLNTQLAIGAYSGNPGALLAQGTAAEPILFTSNLTTPTAGNWYGIRVYDTAADTITKLEYCTLQYAGGGGQGALYIYQASPAIRYITISNSNSHGLYLSGGSPLVDNCRFTSNGNYDLYYSGTIGGSITNSTINNGLSLQAAGAIAFSGNTINQNNTYPVKAYADNVGPIVNGCTFTNVNNASFLEIVSGNVTKDATWTAAIAYVVSSTVTVQGTDGGDSITTLAISPGATLKFKQYTGLTIGGYSGNPGALNAQGTSAAPILFTSNQDIPTAGYWNGIQLNNTTNDTTTILDYCNIQYAGGGGQGGIYIYQSAPTIRNTAVTNSSSYGLFLSGGAPVIDSCRFYSNGNYDLYYSGTIGGSVANSTINNGINLLATGAVAFSGNTLSQNNAYPIKAYADNVGSIVGGCSFTNVSSDSFLFVNSGTISHDALWTAAIPYFVSGNLNVQGSDGSDGVTTLNLAAGAKMKFNSNASLTIANYSGTAGALKAQGTATTPIVFTSNQTVPAAGDWNNIQFLTTTDSTASMLEYCVVEYGGSGNQGAVYLYNAKPTIKNCTIRNNKDKGLNIYGAGCNGAEIRGNTFSGNGYGIYLSGNAQPLIGYNNFSGNSSYGLYNASSIAATADFNWWGDAQGPGLSGDRVYGNVAINSWLSQNYDSTSPTNRAPLATNDAVVTDEDTPVSIQVLSNDSDPDGDPLRLTGFTQAANGTVTDRGNGSLLYTPRANYNGTDRFSYTITDGTYGATASVTITINPVNDPPIAEAGVDQKVALNQLVSLDGKGSSDPEGSSLIYNWSFISRPSGSNAVLYDSNRATAVFMPDVVGTFTVQLTVSDSSFTAADNVKIIVIGLPTVSLTANPPVITQGGASTMIWETANAETVRIDPGIGVVGLSGSVTVSPESATSYVLTATGPGGTISTSSLVTIGSPFVLQIDAPKDQQTINRPDVLVRGFIQNSAGRETGVIVNGIAALRYGTQFMANHVPLLQGENTITVVATDSTGQGYTTHVAVHVDTSGEYCSATIEPSEGLVPFRGEINIASPCELLRSTFDDFGPGKVEYGLGRPGRIPLVINQPGIYRIEVDAKCPGNRTYFDEVAVLIVNTKQLEVLLKEKWNAMKACLTAGNVAGALQLFKTQSRARYEKTFTALNDQLPRLAQEMPEIELIQADNGFAKCRTRQAIVIQGQTHNISFDIYFSTDEHGIWQIDRF